MKDSLSVMYIATIIMVLAITIYGVVFFTGHMVNAQTPLPASSDHSVSTTEGEAPVDSTVTEYSIFVIQTLSY